MVSPCIGAAFEVVEPELVVEFAVVLLDPPAALRQADEATEAQRFAPQIRQSGRGPAHLRATR